ncbi:MAG: shikimate kinase AroK [Pseudomonadales bacterium]|nr:shikimate kinase AroK [Pseudomonadales bacterium]
MKECIFLVGPMGAGKSTIGRMLAKRLNLEFKDSDHEIEHRTGADISWIFDVEGEEGFRRREMDVIDELTDRTGIVLATGGGAVLRPENREKLRMRGEVVYLKLSVEHQAARTEKDRNRPLLQNDNPRQVLDDLFRERDPLYCEIADFVIHTDNKTAKAVTEQIVAELQHSRQPSPEH